MKWCYFGWKAAAKMQRGLFKPAGLNLIVQCFLMSGETVPRESISINSHKLKSWAQQKSVYKENCCWYRTKIYYEENVALFTLLYLVFLLLIYSKTCLKTWQECRGCNTVFLRFSFTGNYIRDLRLWPCTRPVAEITGRAELHTDVLLWLGWQHYYTA